MKLLRRTWADIALDNLAHNYQMLRQAVPAQCKFLGVVKADAYGHGAVPVSRQLQTLGAEFLAVSNLEEALQLRRADIALPILILGYTPAVYAPDMADMDIRQEVHSLDYAQQLSHSLAGTGKTLTVHLKLDTGMSRLGFFAYDCPDTLAQLRDATALPHLAWEGVFTHFPVADSYAPADRDFTRRQYARFMAMIDDLAAMGIAFAIRHCCNSAATMLYPEFALDMIRPGIATYGISPSPELAGRMDLRPLMSLRTTISQIRTFQPGIGISYGQTYTTSTQRRIAVLSIGYADGLPRCLSGKLTLLLHGRPIRQVGRICMDMCMADITDVPQAQVGDTVTLFGQDGGRRLAIEDWAAQTGTIAYEYLCDINKRTPRIYWEGTKKVEVLQYIV